MGRIFSAPKPPSVQEQLEAQRRLQMEAEERAEQRRREEEERALQKAASEMRARMAVSQGRRSLRFGSNIRETLNQMGLLG